MRRRGMSLLEMAVVTAILLALASVIVPAMVTWSRAAALPEAQSQVEAAMLMARADAQRQATPVRLLARVGADGIVELIAESVMIPATCKNGEEPAEGACESVRIGAVYALPRGVSVMEEAPGEVIPKLVEFLNR